MITAKQNLSLSQTRYICHFGFSALAVLQILKSLGPSQYVYIAFDFFFSPRFPYLPLYYCSFKLNGLLNPVIFSLQIEPVSSWVAQISETVSLNQWKHNVCNFKIFHCRISLPEGKHRTSVRGVVFFFRLKHTVGFLTK